MSNCMIARTLALWQTPISGGYLLPGKSVQYFGLPAQIGKYPSSVDYSPGFDLELTEIQPSLPG